MESYDPQDITQHNEDALLQNVSPQDTSENTLQITSQDTSQDNEDILQDILQDTPDNSSQIGVKKPRSIVHNHFTLDIENNKYKCNHCDKSYQIAKDGSTSTFKKHLQTKHNHLFSVDQLTDAMNKLEISLVNILIYFSYFV
ncbi:unnamed protein product [Rhizophagus irregularis]|nr:unnamed protein product [Rhizophagus irregularis]CAB5379016.1 unnamed protein product [Rhizophagus irregularis]